MGPGFESQLDHHKATRNLVAFLLYAGILTEKLTRRQISVEALTHLLRLLVDFFSKNSNPQLYHHKATRNLVAFFIIRWDSKSRDVACHVRCVCKAKKLFP